jgi:hypothetical protein
MDFRRSAGTAERHTPSWHAVSIWISTHGGTLAYSMHAGGHGMIPSDWDLVLNYVKSDMKPAPR